MSQQENRKKSVYNASLRSQFHEILSAATIAYITESTLYPHGRVIMLHCN